MFLKSLIGNHFHYTVFGLDWLKERWQQANPPTYGEFAQFWQAEYLRRKGTQQELKPEWAYLNFMRAFKGQRPSASKQEALADWETVRMRHKNAALLLLQKYKGY